MMKGAEENLESSSIEGKSGIPSQKADGSQRKVRKPEKMTRRQEKKQSFMQSSWPTVIDLQQYERRKYYPETYYSNKKKENVLIWLANKFSKICLAADSQQRPILLTAENECKIQKMVCTTIRPTKIRYPEFYRWQGCAQFIADNIDYEPLEKPVMFPEYIRSPDTVLSRQKANCFELAILLVSCLIGSGYDAYVVSGYATREVCINDQTRTKCPYIPQKETRKEETVQRKENKYIPKPPPDFSSKFQKMMKERELKRIADLEKENREREKRRIAELEKIPPDDIHGYRRHGWALVLSGARGIQEPFYIEPSTGVRFSTNDPQYLRVDSIWNSCNYWFHLAKINPCHFDLDDTNKWKRFINENPWQEYGEDDESHNLDYNDTILARKHMDVLSSWVKPLEISCKRYQERYPNGAKKIYFYKAKCQLYAPYVLDSGLIQSIDIYEDFECNTKKYKYELFENRYDCLYKIETDIQTGDVVEYFMKGRSDSLEQYRYRNNNSNSSSELMLQFYHTACYDGLYRITLNITSMTMEYLNREDLLRYKYCEFKTNEENKQKRAILSIKEMFDKKSKNELDGSIAMRGFDLKNDRIQIRYHHSAGQLVSSAKTFQKMLVPDSNEITFQPDMCIGYEFDPASKTHEDLHALFLKLLNIERQTIANVKNSFEEVDKFLAAREKERIAPKLKVSIFDPLRNERINQEMKKKEEVDSLRARNEIEGDLDYLLPYFIKFENRRMSYDEAQQLYKKCLGDFESTQLKRAAILRNKLSNMKEKLMKKENEYETSEDKDCAQSKVLGSEIEQIKQNIHVLDARLSRHKKLTTTRHKFLAEKLLKDPRLKVLDIGGR
ncbi:dynein regulatory complex subunit 7 [Bemisia tabaci]